MILLLSFFFGITTKYADLFNEHGLKPPFRGAEVLAGIAWGVLGGFLIISEEHVAVLFTALVLYWIYQIKLDYLNHAIGGVIMLLVSFGYLKGAHQSELVVLTGAYILSGMLHSFLRTRVTDIRYLRLRFYLIPLAYSCFIRNFSPFFATLMGLIGVESVNYLHYHYERLKSR